MYRLPLFPLNSVLFPKMPINLHIFEERYQLMIRRCVDSKQPFGVVLIESGSEVAGLGAEAIPLKVGCTAVIAQVQQLALGRMNIIAVGQQRFRIHALEYDEPYLVGLVEDLPIIEVDHSLIAVATRGLRFWLEKYLAILERTEQAQFDRSQLPSDDLELAYLAASLLKIPMEEKQELLTQPDTAVLVDQIRLIYRKEVTYLNMVVAQPSIPEDTPFSIN